MVSCSALECRVRLRGRFLARVHDGRLGQGVQSDGEKSTWIILRPRAVFVSNQRTLLRP